MSTTQPSDDGQASAQRHPAHVQVTVLTTSGIFPAHGHSNVPATEIVNDELRKAAHALHLTDTSGWVVTSGGQDVNPLASYLQNGLAGTVELHWGPRESGGGN